MFNQPFENFAGYPIEEFKPDETRFEPGKAYRISLNWDDYYGGEPIPASIFTWILAMIFGRFTGKESPLYKIRRQFKEKLEPLEYYEIFFESETLENIEALVIGNWHIEGAGSVAMITERLLCFADRFTKLEHLFIGDILEEDATLQELELDDISPIFTTFKNLKSFGIRGNGKNLKLGTIESDSLERVILQLSDPNPDILRDLYASKLPNLKELGRVDTMVLTGNVNIRIVRG